VQFILASILDQSKCNLRYGIEVCSSLFSIKLINSSANLQLARLIFLEVDKLFFMPLKLAITTMRSFGV